MEVVLSVMPQAALNSCLQGIQCSLATYQWKDMLLLLCDFTLLDGVETKQEQEGDGGLSKGLCLDVIQPDSLRQTGEDG